MLAILDKNISQILRYFANGAVSRKISLSGIASIFGALCLQMAYMKGCFWTIFPRFWEKCRLVPIYFSNICLFVSIFRLFCPKFLLVFGLRLPVFWARTYIAGPIYYRASKTPEKRAFLAIFVSDSAYSRRPCGNMKFFFRRLSRYVSCEQRFFGVRQQVCKFSRTVCP